jgi:L-iditol 2-dehydrogenase
MKTTMKAAVLKDRETIVLDEVPVPEPKRGEVLINVKASAICGSDVKGYFGQHSMIKWPVILGHEASGTIAKCGPGVDEWKVGDPVAVEPIFTCKKCHACRSGKYHLCANLTFAGHQVPGSFAEYFTAETEFVHRKPDNVPFEEAALTEPASSPLHAVERGNIKLGDFVVVIGSGVTGLFALQYVLLKGAEVMVCDPADFKLKIAKSLGASHTLNPHNEDLLERVMELTGGIGADCVIEAAGTSETLASTVSLVKKGGSVVLVGYTEKESEPFDLSTVTLAELTVFGSLAYWHDFPVARKLMSRGKVTDRPVITHGMPLEGVEEGIKMMKRKEEGLVKIVVTNTG